jgi:CRP/FNR family cyclic AMP-dependent transcriptional regulator
MSSDRPDALTPQPRTWPPPQPSARRPGSPPLFGYLLDLDDDLAQEIEVRMRFSARQHATARILRADSGACELDSWFETVGDGPGLLLLDGVMAFETRVADRVVTELVGGGDLLQPPVPGTDDLVERCTTWRVLDPARLALLDSDFAERIRSWPQLSRALCRRTERRMSDLAALRAICGQPKLEVRLVLLLWHLAGRWGRVEPSGLRLCLPLTHRLLGQLVAAERPSISHALARLSHAGIVTGSAGDWHLHGSLEDHLENLIDRTPRLSAPEQTGEDAPRRSVRA